MEITPGKEEEEGKKKAQEEIQGVEKIEPWWPRKPREKENRNPGPGVKSFQQGKKSLGKPGGIIPGE